MPYIEANGANLYYESHGEGPAIIFAHGIGGNHAIWYQQVAVFQNSYRVITFDHRGFGNSSDSSDEGRARFVDDLKAIMDALEIEKAALIGQSMGGGTCLCFTAMYPERVSALVLADTLHGFDEPDAVKAMMDEARANTENLSQIERVLGSACQEEDPTAALLYKQISSFNHANRHNLKGQFPRMVDPKELGQSSIMTMFIAGQEDVLFPAKAIEKLQEDVANSFFVEIVGAGHSAFYERPIEFNDSILSFLQAADYSGRSAIHSNSAGYEKVV